MNTQTVKQPEGTGLKGREVLGTGMEVYSNARDPYCHQLRFALRIKNVRPQFIEVKDTGRPPATLRDINPRCKDHAVPTLVERDLVIYHPDILMRYIDDRFPSPPLFPQHPGELARYNIQLWQIKENIVEPCDAILAGKNRYKSSKLESNLLSEVVMLTYRDEERFAISEHPKTRLPDMIDCMLAPVLWRFSVLGMNIPSNVTKYRKLTSYMQWLFRQPAFIESCTEAELEMFTD